MSRNRGRVGPELPWGLLGLATLAAGAVLVAPPPAPRDAYRPLELTAGTSDSRLFAVDRMVPGHPVTNCVAVRYHEAAAGGDIRLHAVVRAGDLGPYLGVTVRTGSGGGAGCAGFVPAATPYHGRLSTLAGARPVLHLAGADGEVTFQVTVAVADVAAAQGRSVRFDLVWSATAPPPAASRPSSRPGGIPGADKAATGPGAALRRLLHALGRFAAAVGPPLLRAGAVGAPVSALVVLFLLAQNRFDRRDPKLALAPIRPLVQLEFTERSTLP